MDPVAVPIAVSDGIVILVSRRPPVNGQRPIASDRQPPSLEFLPELPKSADGEIPKGERRDRSRTGRSWTV